MFAMPLVYTQQLVADRQRSYEAAASRRRMRRQARHQIEDAPVAVRRPERVQVTTPVIRHATVAGATAPRVTPVSKVA
jgi:hypothetical protein